MAKPRQIHPRIQAQITGKAIETAIETHEKNVLAITRAIHRLHTRRKRLQAELKAIATDLRARRRELRAVLQRDSSVTHEDDRRLTLAGKADAIDATDAAREQPQAETPREPHGDTLHWLGRKTGGAVTWTAFYRACREEMAFRYGKVRVPTDYYKEHFVPEGSDVQQAVRTVYQRLRAEGRVP